MAKLKPPSTEFEVGSFICPNTKVAVPLRTEAPLPFLHWPILVRKCPGCNREHKLELRDVQHLPVYGYE